MAPLSTAVPGKFLSEGAVDTPSQTGQRPTGMILRAAVPLGQCSQVGNTGQRGEKLLFLTFLGLVFSLVPILGLARFGWAFCPCLYRRCSTCAGSNNSLLGVSAEGGLRLFLGVHALSDSFTLMEPRSIG